MSLIRSAPLMRVHVIEDEDDLREEMVFSLGEFGFEVHGFSAAPAFYRAFALAPCDIAVVDIGLPGESGLSIASHLRRNRRIGVVLVTARWRLEDRLHGLRQGADAYLAKPVVIEELAETLNAIGRRLHVEPAGGLNAGEGTAAAGATRAGAWQLFEGDWILSDPEGRQMKLTTSERAVVACLFRSQGMAVSRDDLIRALGGDIYDFDDHRIDAIASRVRRKAKQMGMHLPLHSVRGTGYVLAT